MLRSLAQVLIDESGKGAVVARYGGEEFGILLAVAPTEALQIVERVRVAVSRHVVVVEGHEIHGITVSSGVAGYPDDGDNDHDILLKADSAMYWGAKQRGRNRTALYTPEFDAQLFVDALTGLYTYHFVTIRLREALSNGAQNWGALCIDISNFSAVNASFGFETGDRVLQEASHIIRESVRNSELACRYSGDEFLILLRDVSAEELDSVGHRIDRLLSTHHFRCLPNVTLSLHVCYQIQEFCEIDNVESLFTQINKVFSDLNTALDSRGAV